MTKKQFALIVLVWVLAMTVIFVTPVRSAEVGLVTTTGTPTCAQASKDFDAVGKRWQQVKSLREVTVDSSMQLALEEELRALIALGGRILMWQSENCRAT